MRAGLQERALEELRRAARMWTEECVRMLKCTCVECMKVRMWNVESGTRARDAAKSCLELGRQKAPSTHLRCCDTACTRSVTTYCGACNVTTACLPLCATYGEGRSEHRASQAQDGHSKRQLYRKGLLGNGWCCSHRQRGIKAGSNKIFPVLSKGDETPQAVLEDS